MTRPIRVLVAKPGLDGHDVGAKLVCRALMAAGMEVIYTGLRQSPKSIARAAVAEQADAVGLSILSGAHLPLCRKVIEELRRGGWEGKCLLVGGNIPRRDVPALEQMGVSGVFPTGASFSAVCEFIRERVKQ